MRKGVSRETEVQKSPGTEQPKHQGVIGAASVEAGCLETSASLEEQECYARPLTRLHPTGTEAFKWLPGTFVSLPEQDLAHAPNASLTSTSQHGKSE